MDSSLRLFALQLLLYLCIPPNALNAHRFESSELDQDQTEGSNLRPYRSDLLNQRWILRSIRGFSLGLEPMADIGSRTKNALNRTPMPSEGSNPPPDPTVAGSQPETRNVTAHYCPFPCTVGNQTLCYPPPCPPPACVDPGRLQPTDCCTYCPNGNNCRAPDGSIIRYDRWKVIDGRNCTCQHVGAQATCV